MGGTSSSMGCSAAQGTGPVPRHVKIPAPRRLPRSTGCKAARPAQQRLSSHTGGCLQAGCPATLTCTLQGRAAMLPISSCSATSQAATDPARSCLLASTSSGAPYSSRLAAAPGSGRGQGAQQGLWGGQGAGAVGEDVCPRRSRGAKGWAAQQTARQGLHLHVAATGRMAGGSHPRSKHSQHHGRLLPPPRACPTTHHAPPAPHAAAPPRAPSARSRHALASSSRPRSVASTTYSTACASP